ncbi:hypothetical protein FITA111629_04845 [Filibacter tadaridae]|uniref:Resolvase HTH domain-containing protein n=1 Tax=Filibacter tadaridae TaxID=2483811 RepID=A0A3P5XCK2_9BACL|nr:hypothetical protein [Filibacter tadaridae]VDC32435.1 hypothetical protein FILTAD_02663 [Filibacter tadaridae]
MNIAIILLIIGLISILASFFFGHSARNYEDELEKVSISLHQETSNLKKRLKVVEEELMVGVNPIPSARRSVRGHQRPSKSKPVHEIIVNQILSLHAQGYSIDAIAKRSSLSNDDVTVVLRSKGVVL